MLELLRGKRMAFVGDSLNTSMWHSSFYTLRMSLLNKSRMSRRQFRKKASYFLEFKDYNCTIDFIIASFIVQQWKIPSKSERSETRKKTLRLDMIQASTFKY